MNLLFRYVLCGQTHKVKPIVAFSNFANALKNCNQSLSLISTIMNKNDSC